MRLIDADKLKEKLQEQQKYGSTSDSKGRAKAIVEVIHAPTIEAEPVKHGQWIEKKPSRMKWIPDESDGITEEETTIEDMVEQKCSVCQRWSIKFAYHIEMNFCPNCGAKMKGDRS